MRWRRQLPAYSPLSLRAVLAGARGLLGGGEKARERLREMLVAGFGARAVLLTDSGTGALTLAIKACLADRPGLAVALPAYGCYDLATAADGADARVVLYDLVPETLAPDIDSLRRALGYGVGAVVLVHLYGIPVDPEPVRALMAKSEARLIEDAAQGSGASLHGKPLGSFGDLSVLSFGRGKGVTAGRGGAVLAPSRAGVELLARVGRCAGDPGRGAKEVVQLAAQWLFGRPSLYAIPSALPCLRLGETVYNSPSAVRTLSAAAACCLLATWPLSEREAAVRRELSARLAARAGRALERVRIEAGAKAGHIRLPVIPSGAARPTVDSLRARRLGIMPGYPKVLSDLRGFGPRVANLREDRWPGARLLAERLITLPTHSLISGRDMAALQAWVRGLGGAAET